jgi:hypothetical protein
MRLLALMSLLAVAPLGAATAQVAVDNDWSCDIANLPAATLLLPYFEVDLAGGGGGGETTIFTVTNVSSLPQVARVTLWTDYAYPVLTFNIFLTGYDVQSINLYDVIGRGVVAPDDGTGLDYSPVGELSGDWVNSFPFDNPVLDEESCVDLPIAVAGVYRMRMQSAFTTGKAPSGGSYGACTTAGGVHSNAVGYATIDVVGNCGYRDSLDARYFTDDIRFDNVLVGDSMQVSHARRTSHGSPMVHIRAIPEGGLPRERMIEPDYRVQFPRTFYDRYVESRLDARQPLPSVFAARWISGGPAGFETMFKIWREAAGAGIACARYPAANGAVKFVEAVRFDEEENPEVTAPCILVPCGDWGPWLPATSATSAVNDAIYPPNTVGDVGGWMYLNLDDRSSPSEALQSWVVTTMRAESIFSADVDAHALGNGCSKQVAASEATAADGPVIGPLPNQRRSQP